MRSALSQYGSTETRGCALTAPGSRKLPSSSAFRRIGHGRRHSHVAIYACRRARTAPAAIIRRDSTCRSGCTPNAYL